MRYYIGGMACDGDYLAHHGVKGQKWGVRRFQNEDGTWTEQGKKRYEDGSSEGKKEDWYSRRIQRIADKNRRKSEKSTAKANAMKEKGKEKKSLKYAKKAQEYTKAQKYYETMKTSYLDLPNKEKRKVKMGETAARRLMITAMRDTWKSSDSKEWLRNQAKWNYYRSKTLGG